MPFTSALVPSGLVLLHKQPGITSFDVLRDIKRALGTGKVGHTGTLDKFAGGLLLVLTGKALKLSQWFTRCDKQYEGAIFFGAETDTLDPEGKIIAAAALPSRDAVEQTIAQFLGPIEQAPPAYSAIHIDGERASTLARRGEVPELRKRPVRIYQLELRSWEPPVARVFVHCSDGTYIRSLARDIARAAGSRAHLSALVRTRVAGFALEDVPAAGIADAPPRPMPIDKTIIDKLGLPRFQINTADAEKMRHGKALSAILRGNNMLFPETVNEKPRVDAAAVFSGDKFIAMLEQLDGEWKYSYVNAGN